MTPAGDPVVLPSDAVDVGRVVDAWGVKGWFKVEPFSAEPQALFSCRQWFIATPDDRDRPQLLKIAEAREHGDVVVARAHGIDDRAAAEALRGMRVLVPRSSFPTPAPDEYYWVDLIGMAVVNRAGQELGAVDGLLETGPTCVLRVRPGGDAAPSPKGRGEILIPFVSAYVDDVRLADRRILVDWEAG